MTSFSPFIGGASWSLTLSIAVEGEMKSQKDGFYFGLSPYRINTYNMNDRYYPKR